MPVPEWVKRTIDLWLGAAGISAGRLFRCVCRAGKHWGDGVTERVVWHVVKQYARKLGLIQVAPHDLRRSCAKLCHASGGELDPVNVLYHSQYRAVGFLPPHFAVIQSQLLF